MTISFVPTPKFRAGRSKSVRAVVIHDMESSESTNTAEAAASMCAHWDADVSWHYAVDVDSVVQSVHESDTAWHAERANSDTIGIEHAGRAAQGRTDWLDNYSLTMLKEVSAPLVADICKRYGIPPVKIDHHGYAAGQKGIMGHIDVTNWEKENGYPNAGHWDPGPNFPWDLYIQWVKEAMGSSTPVPQPPQPPANPGTVEALRALAALIDSFKVRPARIGERTSRIRFLQAVLNTKNHAGLTVDGIFGAHTDRAVRAFQLSRRLVADGIVGPKTIEALAH